MRWRGGRQSTNVEDYRGRRAVGTGLKLGGGAIVALLLAWFFGVDPRLIMGVMEGVQTNQVEPPPGVCSRRRTRRWLAAPLQWF
jgi:predicted metalloprotease